MKVQSGSLRGIGRSVSVSALANVQSYILTWNMVDTNHREDILIQIGAHHQRGQGKVQRCRGHLRCCWYNTVMLIWIDSYTWLQFRFLENHEPELILLQNVNIKWWTVRPLFFSQDLRLTPTLAPRTGGRCRERSPLSVYWKYTAPVFPFLLFVVLIWSLLRLVIKSFHETQHLCPGNKPTW